MAANDTVIKFRALVDELRQQKDSDASRLYQYGSADAYEKWRRVLQDDFVFGWHQTGNAVVLIRSTTPGSSERQWLVEACLDVRGVDVVDKSGKSTRDRPGGVNHIVYTVDLLGTAQRWYVTKETFDGGSC